MQSGITDRQIKYDSTRELPLPLAAYRYGDFTIAAFKHDAGWGFSICTAKVLKTRLLDGTWETLDPGHPFAMSRRPDGVLGARGFESPESALFGAKHLIDDWQKAERRRAEVSKAFGALGHQARRIQYNERLEGKKLLAALLATAKLTGSGSKSFSTIAREATELQNPTDAWRNWLLPGFRQLCNMTVANGIRGARDLLEKNTGATEIGNRKAERFVWSLQDDDDLLRKIDQALNKFLDWLARQKKDYTLEQAIVEDLINTIRGKIS